MSNRSEKNGRSGACSPFLSWDGAGVIASLVCGIHCLATPLLLALVPGMGLAFLEDDLFHPILASTGVVIAAVALRKGYFRHRDSRVVALAALGAVLLLFAAFNIGHLLNESQERGLMLLGGILISSSHVWNWRRIGHCASCTLK